MFICSILFSTCSVRYFSIFSILLRSRVFFLSSTFSIMRDLFWPRKMIFAYFSSLLGNFLRLTGDAGIGMTCILIRRSTCIIIFLIFDFIPSIPLKSKSFICSFSCCKLDYWFYWSCFILFALTISNLNFSNLSFEFNALSLIRYCRWFCSPPSVTIWMYSYLRASFFVSSRSCSSMISY